MSPVKSIELRDERGTPLKVENADSNIAVSFDREEVEEATPEEERVTTNVSMVMLSFEVNQPGTCIVEVILTTQKVKETCVQLFSRKRRPANADMYDQTSMARARKKKKTQRFVYKDVERGDSDAPHPVHHLAYRPVKCAKSNVSDGYVMTSPVVETVLSISLKTYVHCCSFWDPKKRKWSGDGCQVG